jgi:glutamate formiminotransferase
LVLAVPNASVNDEHVLASLPSAHLLDAQWDKDHGRAVLTCGAPAESIVGTCLTLMTWAVSRLRLRSHRGVHPRFGVVDVLPIVPFGRGVAARDTAVELGGRIETELKVPVHFYGRADPQGRSLPDLRRHLRSAPHEMHPTAGVVCIGVRDPLVAFNVNFHGDLGLARRVARDARTADVRTLGLELPSRGLVQVSMNLIAPERVGPNAAFERIVSLAHDLELVDCEVVGLVPHPILAELEGLPLRKPVRSIEQALEEKGFL